MNVQDETKFHATILVIDGDHDSLEIVSVQLKQIGYNVLPASGMLEGEVLALTQAPDLIVIDPGLPGRNGIELAARLKENPKTTFMPIIAYTVWDKETYKRDARKAGITEFLLKPASPRVLKGLIEKLLQKTPVASVKNGAEMIAESSASARRMAAGRDDLFVAKSRNARRK